MAVKIQEHNSLVSKKFTNISFYRYVICTANTEFHLILVMNTCVSIWPWLYVMLRKIIVWKKAWENFNITRAIGMRMSHTFLPSLLESFSAWYSLKGHTCLTHSLLMHPFSAPLKTSENLTVFWRFQGAEKWCIGNEWVKQLKIF